MCHSFFESNREKSCIESHWFLTKLQTKLSWLLLYGPWCTSSSLSVFAVMPALQLCTCQHCDWVRCKICRIVTKFVRYLPVYCARCLAVSIPICGANIQCRILWRACGTRVRLHSQLPRERWSRSAPSFAWDAVPHLRSDQGNYLNILYLYKNTFVFLHIFSFSSVDVYMTLLLQLFVVLWKKEDFSRQRDPLAHPL